jgi:glycosyltransferase involved in cell wall biosynthesis
MRTLVLITSNFPFGTGEPFLETELPVICREFAGTIIISRNTSSLNQRDLPENVIIYRYNTSTTFRGFLNLPFLLLKNLPLISEIHSDEKKYRKEISSSLSIRQDLFLLRKIIKALQLRDFIKRILRQLKTDSEIVFYSYWSNSGAHAAALLSYRNSIRISRAHRHDLYEEMNHLSYLPLLRFLALKMDSVFFISGHGREYFIKKTGIESPRLTVSYLGVKTPESVSFANVYNETFTIVSCSNLSDLKRVDMIIESLAVLKTVRKIRWLHFGEGPLLKSLDNLADIRLGLRENIRYKFMGQISNSELLRFYGENKVDLFINTSLSEGIPVSIMEAQSYGTPVIATDTGGVSELVAPGTGFLLPLNFNPEYLADKISAFLNMTEDELMKIRDNAFRNRKNNFDAGTNYRDFIKKVNSIFESSINQG